MSSSDRPTFDAAALETLKRIMEATARAGSGDDTSDEPVTCPNCGSALRFDPVPRPEAVSYVRSRVWVRCEGCGRAGVVDGP